MMYGVALYNNAQAFESLSKHQINRKINIEKLIEVN